ncbi:hypothetical protein NZK35_09025 [Stieleria sp. ICT_E10.1]|uniref:hypothetical protein n=1 Tax=Stieleria sedimenti TaxID=2976331 RepID=UPI00217FC72F|nr:hypothetical protein [Stieleria sedimenti]MCS7466783.1 hypothetical protein [Stieleria sedimenti]
MDSNAGFFRSTRQRSASWATVGLMFLLLALVSQSAHAGLMAKYERPDIYVQQIIGDTQTGATAPKWGMDFTAYDAVTDVLKLKGSATLLKLPSGTDVNLKLGSGSSGPAAFTLEATIDENGILGAGMFSINGVQEDDSLVTVPLLTGTLTKVEYDFNGPGRIEFLANSLNGELQPVFGSEVVIAMNKFTDAVSFATSFFAMGAEADIGRPVPEPTSAIAWLCGLAALGMRRPSRHRH